MRVGERSDFGKVPHDRQCLTPESMLHLLSGRIPARARHATHGHTIERARKQVTDLVRQVYLRANAIRPSIKISAALITWGSGPATDAEYRARDAYRQAHGGVR